MVYTDIIDKIEVNRNRRLSGKVNCIPWGMPKLELYNPGLEKKHYYLFTAGSKEAKTQIADHMCMYNPYEYMKSNPDKGIKIKSLYFSLEMSKQVKGIQAITRKLWMDSNKEVRQSIKDILSISNNEDGVLKESILNIIKSKEYVDYYTDFYNCWTFVHDIRHSFKIGQFIDQFFEKEGKWSYIHPEWADNPIKDKWIPNDPDTYYIIIVDHASLIVPTTTENKSGRGLWQAMKELSNILMKARDNYGATPILIQQQSLEKEGNKSHELGRLEPSADGLSDNKSTIRDINTCFGIFSPWKRQLTHYPDKSGYNITNYQDHIRFLKIIASREGGAGNMFPLFFDGAVNWFQEMPKVNDTINLNKIKSYLEKHKLLD